MLQLASPGTPIWKEDGMHCHGVNTLQIFNLPTSNTQNSPLLTLSTKPSHSEGGIPFNPAYTRRREVWVPRSGWRATVRGEWGGGSGDVMYRCSVHLWLHPPPPTLCLLLHTPGTYTHKKVSFHTFNTWESVTRRLKDVKIIGVTSYRYQRARDIQLEIRLKMCLSVIYVNILVLLCYNV